MKVALTARGKPASAGPCYQSGEATADRTPLVDRCSVVKPVHGETMCGKDTDMSTGHDDAMGREQQVVGPAVRAVISHQRQSALMAKHAPP